MVISCRTAKTIRQICLCTRFVVSLFLHAFFPVSSGHLFVVKKTQISFFKTHFVLQPIAQLPSFFDGPRFEAIEFDPEKQSNSQEVKLGKWRMKNKVAIFPSQKKYWFQFQQNFSFSMRTFFKPGQLLCSAAQNIECGSGALPQHWSRSSRRCQNNAVCQTGVLDWSGSPLHSHPLSSSPNSISFNFLFPEN
jgi:hypothetical protein